MSRLRLSHWFSSHLSVILYTVAPALIAVNVSIIIFVSADIDVLNEANMKCSGSSWPNSLLLASLSSLPTTCKVIIIIIIVI